MALIFRTEDGGLLATESGVLLSLAGVVAPPPAHAIGLAEGGSTVSGVGSAIAAATGVAAGSAMADGVIAAPSSEAVGTAAGTSSATGAAAVAFSAWNPADKNADLTLSNENRTAEKTANNGNYVAVRGTSSRAAGKWHLEYLVDVAEANMGLGIGNATAALDNYIGSSVHSIAAYSGSVWTNGGNAGGGPSFTTGDVLVVEVDFDAKTFRVAVNTGSYSGPFSFSGATGPFFAMANAQTLGRGFTLNTGGSAFVKAPTAGYVAWG